MKSPLATLRISQLNKVSANYFARRLACRPLATRPSTTFGNCWSRNFYRWGALCWPTNTA